jgi:tryptophan-rich sensory protein
MKIGKSGLVLWGLYGALALFAVTANLQETTFQFSRPLGGIKAIVWLALFVFLGYSVYCSFQENIFRSVRSIATLHWGRQIGADLYLGLLISLFIIFLNEGALVAVIWLIPVIIYANLAVLLYFAINFDSIVANLLGL